MATRSKKGTPYEVGKEVWVRAKVVRVAPHPRLEGIQQITIEMPNGNKETMGLNEDKVRPADDA